MGKVLIVDIDETLIYARATPNSSTASEEFKKESIKVDWEDDPGYIMVRQSALPFLEHFHGKYEIISLTHGVIPWQEAVFKASGIDKYIKNVYGFTTAVRDKEILPDPLPKEFVMIDNWPHRSSLMEHKAQWLKTTFNDDNFVMCQPWYGGPDPDPLTDLISTVERLLNV